MKLKLDAGRPKDIAEAVEELQAAFGDLEGVAVAAREGAHEDCLEVLAHVGLTVHELVMAMNRANRRSQRWCFCAPRG